MMYNTQVGDLGREWRILMMARAIEGPKSVDRKKDGYIPLYIQQQMRWNKLPHWWQRRRLKQAEAALVAFETSLEKIGERR